MATKKPTAAKKPARKKASKATPVSAIAIMTVVLAMEVPFGTYEP